MDCNEFLEDVKTILSDFKELENEKRINGDYFNIFQVATIDYHEVLMCKIIAELINPNGSHGQGDKYLKLFFETVLNLEYNENFSNFKIIKEYLIDKNRRIDIVIETKNLFIPIEVKIYAGEQKNQCYDYFNYAYKKTNNSKIKVYYLTLFGSNPSSYSYKEKELLEKIIPISFSYNILNWINNCIKNTHIDKINIILKQFKEAIEYITENIKDDVKMKIMEKINLSKENFIAAQKIAESINSVKSDKIYSVFSAIEKKLILHTKLNKDDRIPTKYDFEKNNKNYYKKGSTDNKYVNMCYKLNEFTINTDKYCTALVIEIEHKLYYGTQIFKLNENDEWKQSTVLGNVTEKLCDYYKKKIKDERQLNELTSNPKNTWLFWNYLTIDNNKIDFYTCKNEYLRLYDNQSFDNIINDFIDQFYNEYFDKNGNILKNI